MTNPMLAFGGQMLSQLGMNLSNRIGTGRSLRRQLSREQIAQTQAEAAAGIVGRVEGAKAAGIHPLIAMGSNVGGATLPTGSSFNAVDPGFGQIAMHNREMRMRDEELEYNKSLDAQRAQQAKEAQALQNRAAEAEIRLREAQTARELKAIADSDRDFAASQAVLARQQPSIGLRVPSKPIPSQYISIRAKDGSIIQVPNPEIYGLELPELYGAGTLLAPEGFKPAPPGVQPQSFYRNIKEGFQRDWNEAKKWYNEKILGWPRNIE